LGVLRALDPLFFDTDFFAAPRRPEVFEAADFLEALFLFAVFVERFAGDAFLAAAGFLPALFLEAAFLLAAFFAGTFAPFSRASDNPIAIACLGFFTLAPEPDLSLPSFILSIAFFTVS
jgi:hypothetical protein